MMTGLETDALLDLIRAKRSCVEQLWIIGNRQMTLIEEGRMAGLLDLLVQKQHTLSELKRVERSLDPFRHQPPESRRWRSEADRQSCAEVLQACEQMLSKIVAQERACEQAMVRCRDNAARQLQGMHQASLARTSYSAPAAGSAGQLDLSSEAS